MRDLPDSATAAKAPSGVPAPSTVGARTHTMSTQDPVALNGRHQTETDRLTTTLRREALGFDARDVLAGRVDDTTVRQAAAEVDR